jgi:gamma-butyrobetaine dioxygenase
MSKQLNPWWLRERCQSEATVDPDTKQPKLNPHEYAEELFLTEAKVTEDQGVMEVSFSDGHVSHYSLPQLKAELADFQHSPIQVTEYKKPPPRTWSAHNSTMPVYDFSVVSDDIGARLALIEELLTGGQALVRGVPREDGAVIRFGQTLSTLRATDWGPCFNVRTKPDVGHIDSRLQGGPKKDLAYTPKPIGFHTDNPYRWPTPDFQLLHAIDHCECPDGEAPCEKCQVMNYMVDGYYIAEKLFAEDPEAFRLLCEVPVRFENNGGDNGSALVHVAPHFELETGVVDATTGMPRLRAIRFSAKSGQYAPPLDPETLAAFYLARQRFSAMLHDEQHVMSLQFKPGDCLVFDNQRVLHARSEIAPTDGERWVQGCYIDRDGLWLNFERWRRRNP